MAASHEIFDFFGLPRELRDVIYVLCLVDTPFREFDNKCAEDESEDGFKAQLRDAPVTELLLVNRQFSEEYRSSAKLVQKLFVEDHIESQTHDPYFKAETLPSAMKVIARAHFELSIRFTETCHIEPEHCRVHKDINLHMRWIPALLFHLP
jgi:hypothetical protein